MATKDNELIWESLVENVYDDMYIEINLETRRAEQKFLEHNPDALEMIKQTRPVISGLGVSVYSNELVMYIVKQDKDL